MKNAHNPCFVGEYYFTITCLQIIIYINVQNVKLFYVVNGFTWIRIHHLIGIQIPDPAIFFYGSGSGEMIPTDSTDPNPRHWVPVPKKIKINKLPFHLIKKKSSPGSFVAPKIKLSILQYCIRLPWYLLNLSVSNKTKT